MSNKALNWAWNQPIPSVPKLILVYLADAANEENLCWPSQTTIAEKCSLNRSTVNQYIRWLERRELITEQKRADVQGHRIASLYLLHLSKVVNTNVGNSNVGDTNVGNSAPKVVLSAPKVGDANSIEPSRTIKNPHKETKKLKTVSKKKVTIPDDWTPSERCWELVQKAGIPKAFATEQVDEFILYWQERGEKRPGWEATFLNRVKEQWSRRPRTVEKPEPTPLCFLPFPKKAAP